MDEADRAEVEIEMELQECIRSHRKPAGPAYTGFCLLPGCGEPVDEGRRFCEGTGCRDEYERIQAAMLRNGEALWLND